MTTITINRATVEQALEALVWEAGSEPALYAAQTYKAIAALRAALAQQAEPVEPVAWAGDPSTQDYASTVPDPQIESHLARHGIPMPGNPK